MTSPADLVPAVGGTRSIRRPDPIATEYLLLGLRFDQHLPGLVDGYYGPADLKAQADTGQLSSPRRLLDDVASLAARLPLEVEVPERREWLASQLAALEAHARALAGEPLPYIDYVERCMGFRPRRHDDAEFTSAIDAIDALLPEAAPVADRLAAFDRQLEVPVERIPEVADWLLGRFRARAAESFGLPEGESLRVAVVRDRPWIAYDWYLGGRRSRVEINADLPVTAPELIVTLAHEAYPGHHLEGAWHETDLVDGHGRLEASMILTNTPEGPVSEGLASYGTRFASPLEERAELIVEVLERAGAAIADDRAAAHDAAARAVALIEPRNRLDTATEEAALRLYADGASHDEALTYMIEVARYPPDVAAKRLEFIEDPLSRLYVFAYDEGEALVASWVETAEAPDQVGRFGRLLHEQVTPGRLLRERA